MTDRNRALSVALSLVLLAWLFLTPILPEKYRPTFDGGEP